MRKIINAQYWLNWYLGRRGLFSKELMTIKTLELWEGDLPSITYHLTEQDLEDQVIRTVGGLVKGYILTHRGDIK